MQKSLSFWGTFISQTLSIHTSSTRNPEYAPDLGGVIYEKGLPVCRQSPIQVEAIGP